MDFYLRRRQTDTKTWLKYLKKAQNMGFTFSTNSVKLFKDKDGLYHGQRFCWQARNETLVSPSNVVSAKIPACTECSGWQSSSFGEYLEYFLYFSRTLENKNKHQASFEEIIASLYPYRHIINFSSIKHSELADYADAAREECLQQARNSLDSLPIDNLILALAGQSFRTDISFNEVDIFTRWVEGLKLFSQPKVNDDFTEKLDMKLRKEVKKSRKVLVAAKINDPSDSGAALLADESLLLAWRNLPHGGSKGVSLLNVPILAAQTMTRINPSLVAYSSEPEYDLATLKFLKILLEDSNIDLIKDLHPAARALSK